MRVIHLVRPNPTAGLEPLCGSWGSMDADWTTVASEVDCAGCVAELRRAPAAAPLGAEHREVAAGAEREQLRAAEDGGGWSPAGPTRNALALLMAAGIAFLGVALLLRAGRGLPQPIGGQGAMAPPSIPLLAIVVLFGLAGALLVAMAGKVLLEQRQRHSPADIGHNRAQQ